MNVAVTGASGGLGRRIAELLIETMDPTQLLLLSRTPDTLAGFEKRGASVRKASFKNPTGLKEVLAGVDRLLMISSGDVDKRLDLQRQTVALAQQVGVQHIIYTSMAQPSADNPSFVIPDHAGTEQAIRESGMEWTFLRNNVYAEGLVIAGTQAVASGTLLTNAGDGGTAYVTRNDCARAAAAVVTTDGHEHEAYDITGPEALTQAELAALLSEVTDKPVALEQLDDDAYFDRLYDAGIPQETADLMASFGEATRKGFLKKVSSDLSDLTGRPATTVREVLERNRERLRGE
ncbi:MAG: SDR family oxidoreductase [Solirubrobacteraceae bacterium]|nr:SDR family oxidoreductase [Solirubrobacteraceae bacterium]